jgi:hypothetical protein
MPMKWGSFRRILQISAGFLPAFLLLFILPTELAAARGGSTGATFLELGIGARAAAMGHAMTAWADDVYGMHFNPAGIAGARRRQIGFTHNTLVLDLDYNYLAYLHPFRDESAFAISGLYVDLGTIDRYEIVGGVATPLGKASGHDVALSGTYARQVTEWLDLGLSVKFINESLDRYDAQAVAVDLGARWHPPVPGLTIGLSLLNLGTRLKFVSQQDELPLTLRAGVGYRSDGGRWGLTGDVIYVKNQEIEGAIGAEFWVVPKILALRAGANSAADVASGLSVGAGFLWNDIGVDYAYVPFGDLGDQHLISLAYQFGPDRGERRRETPITTRAPERPRAGLPQEAPPSSTMPSRIAPPVVARRIGLGVEPFIMRAGAPGDDWIGPATSEVLADAWRRLGIMTPASLSPEIAVNGEYWVVDRNLIVNAAVVLPDGSTGTAYASGRLANPFEIWKDLRAKIERIIAPVRPEWRMISEVPPLAPVPAPPPMADRTPISPAPVAAPVAGGVALSPITEHGSSRETERSRLLGAELSEALSRLGLSVDPARAVARFEAQYADLEGDRLVIYGRVIDRATGIPLGTVEIHGAAGNLRATADRLADAILLRLPARP